VGKKVEYANDVCEMKTKESGQKSGICEMEYAKWNMRNGICEMEYANSFFYHVSLFYQFLRPVS
jgi:hypothetical protein